MIHLLPQRNQYFKANLHTHSTISDGKLSPEEVIKSYKQKGYQILSLTDHDIIVDHSAMNDDDFLMLTGVEINFNSQSYRPGFDGKVYHLNLIAKDPKNLWYPGERKARFPHCSDYKDKMQFEGMPTEYDVNQANAIIAKANEKGFLVMYNHPTWSCNGYEDYAPLKGLWAMELRNSECCRLGNNENNFRVFKDMMNLGTPLFPVGTDDMHYPEALGQSWIMVGAEELSYGKVIDALENGDFYMSCGPEISQLTIDGNILRIKCTDAKCINLESHGRFARSVSAEEGNLLCQAEFDLTKFFELADESMYIHLTVTAPDGTYAATRGYYLKDLTL